MEENRLKTLLDQVCGAIRLEHYSYRTEQAYVGWIKRHTTLHGVCPPPHMGAPEVEDVLAHLAAEDNTAVTTRNQALRPFCPSIATCCARTSALLNPRAKRTGRLATGLTDAGNPAPLPLPVRHDPPNGPADQRQWRA